nr:MAG TPA: hypothetical protein [Caudoviricetes sp.]
MKRVYHLKRFLHSLKRYFFNLLSVLYRFKC